MQGTCAALSHRGGAVVERHGVLGLGEEQPALDHEARARQHRRQQRTNRRRPAGAQRDGGEHEQQRRGEATPDRHAAQLGGVLAGDPVAHFLLQKVLRGARRFEQADLAEVAEAGRGLGGGSALVAVDEAPVPELQQTGENDRGRRQPGEPILPDRRPEDNTRADNTRGRRPARLEVSGGAAIESRGYLREDDGEGRDMVRKTP